METMGSDNETMLIYMKTIGSDSETIIYTGTMGSDSRTGLPSGVELSFVTKF